MEAHEMAEKAWRAETARLRKLFEEGQKYERKRIRKRLLNTVRRIAFTARDGGVGGAEAVVVLRSELIAALDKIVPEEG